jgi:hypothetical protein
MKQGGDAYSRVSGGAPFWSDIIFVSRLGSEIDLDTEKLRSVTPKGKRI